MALLARQPEKERDNRDKERQIARRYPIMIVQLSRMEDRSCGSGAQLGFQYSRGRYLMLMDGDMELRAGFVPVTLIDGVLWVYRAGSATGRKLKSTLSNV